MKAKKIQVTGVKTKKTQGPEVKTKQKTQETGVKTKQKPRIQGLKLKTQDPGVKAKITQEAGVKAKYLGSRGEIPKTQDPGVKAQNPKIQG